MRVYPRVGGGTMPACPVLADSLGLSPRGRGNRRQASKQIVYYRSIPAWAAVIAPPMAPVMAAPVYPRVGGGTMSGEAAAGAADGLSPRGRGNRLHEHVARILWGSIPAWAGEPGSSASWTTPPAVYPRWLQA